MSVTKGDTVQIVDDTVLNNPYSVGDTGTVRKVDGNDIYVKMDSTGHIQVMSDKDIKRIGGDDSIQDVDAIAVEVDNKNLGKAIQREAFDHSWEWFYGDATVKELEKDYLIFQREGTGQPGIHSSNKAHNGKNLGKLSENWNKVVEFLEQNQKPEPPAFSSFDTEINEAPLLKVTEISVGCWDGYFGQLQTFRDVSQEISVVKGTVKVKTPNGLTEVDITDLFEFIDELEDYLND